MGEKGGKAAGGGTMNKDAPADIDESENKPEGGRQAVAVYFLPVCFIFYFFFLTILCPE